MLKGIPAFQRIDCSGSRRRMAAYGPLPLSLDLNSNGMEESIW